MGIIPDSAPKFRFDLRSDIVAPPSASVASAVIAAAGRHGEFGWRSDPIEQALERKVCQLLDKPAAAIFPTCTAANIAALVALGAASRTLIMDRSCHLMTNERAGLDWIARPRLQTFAQTVGSIDLSTCHDEPDAILCLENTHNRLGGAVLSADETNRAAQRAKASGWSVFLDGSRLWNASVASGESPAALAGPADLVSVSFNKGLGAPNGAAIAGNPDIVAAAAEAWRRVGGICRPSHVISAGGLAALDEIQCLKQDHELAREAAAAIAELPAFTVTRPQTNIVLVSAVGLGLSGEALATVLDRVGLGCLPFGPQHIRLVFHRGIPAGSAPLIAEIFRGIVSDDSPATRATSRPAIASDANRA
ncbi:threonine aldolase family protein [Bradyrhizobium sp. AZCC 2230]|uniref:threonine aldolase family protein n=1 Tax=Bradyrhizobium sp. AZCC 2230 TaxID=3117021 RepID=UPI002FF2AE27